jgi:hypothetical protein
MIGVGGIRPSRGLSGSTDGFRAHGDRDFGSSGVLGRELVEQRHDLPDHVAHRVVARSRRGFAQLGETEQAPELTVRMVELQRGVRLTPASGRLFDAFLIRIVFKAGPRECRGGSERR